MAKKEMFVTPKGEARFPWLTTPDTKFGGDGKYSVELRLDPNDPEVEKLLSSIDAETKAYFTELAKKDKKKQALLKTCRSPVKPDIDRETGEESGMVLLKFTSAYKPRMFDAARQPIGDDVRVGSGSIIRVAYAKNFYEGFGGGMNLYLQQVQVIKLVEYGSVSAPADGFAAEEGFQADQPPPEEFGGDKAKPEDDDDQIPGLGTEEPEDEGGDDADPVYDDIDAALADDKKLNLADRCAKAKLGHAELKPIFLEAKKNPVMFRIKLNSVLKAKGA